jgi:hypothetical protein
MVCRGVNFDEGLAGADPGMVPPTTTPVLCFPRSRNGKGDDNPPASSP